MSYKIKVIFGKEQVTKTYNGEPLNDYEQRLNVKEYSFNSFEEKLAFIKGINEAVGWTECCIPEFEFRNTN